MATFKKVCTLLAICACLPLAHGQYTIEPAEGYTPQIGIMVDMLEDLKDRITEQVKDLDQEQTDFLFDEDANSIGALVMHLVANESYYMVETLEERSWNPEEVEFWSAAGGLGPDAREKHKGKPIKYYLDLWDAIRSKTLAGLKTKDDAWFASEVDEGVNNHWVWFHVMEHSANHMGQIALVKNRLPESPE